MQVAIVKYNAGNVYSVVNAVRRLGIDPVLTDDPVLLGQADRVIFPGQGEARTAMEYLHQHGLVEVIRSLKQPVLGILHRTAVTVQSFRGGRCRLHRHLRRGGETVPAATARRQGAVYGMEQNRGER